MISTQGSFEALRSARHHRPRGNLIVRLALCPRRGQPPTTSSKSSSKSCGKDGGAGFKRAGAKKGFLFTLMTLMLLVPLFFLAAAYLDRNKAMQSVAVDSEQSSQARFIEDDVFSNSYSDVLGVGLSGITRSANSDYVNVTFNKFCLVSGRNYSVLMSEYENFVETDYSHLNNVNVTLDGFNNTFMIWPYNNRVETLGESVIIYTVPYGFNQVREIALVVDVSAQNNSLCSAPSRDPNNPSISVTYNFEDSGGIITGSCTNSVELSPTRNNDASGHQFYLETTAPAGFIEVKYGQIGGIVGDGILQVTTQNITANITQLNIKYDTPDPDSKILLTGGRITISSPVNDFVKSHDVILAEE